MHDLQLYKQAINSPYIEKLYQRYVLIVPLCAFCTCGHYQSIHPSIYPFVRSFIHSFILKTQRKPHSLVTVVWCCHPLSDCEKSWRWAPGFRKNHHVFDFIWIIFYLSKHQEPFSKMKLFRYEVFIVHSSVEKLKRRKSIQNKPIKITCNASQKLWSRSKWRDIESDRVTFLENFNN